MDMLLMFLPYKTRRLVMLGRQIIASLDTTDERDAAVDYGIKMLKDGRVTVAEWAKFGSKLGVLKGPR